MLLWETLMASNSGKRGTSASDAAVSAAAIKAINPSAQDGVYWIDLPTVGPTQIYCIMNSAYDGGGWMMAMKATRGTTFNYNANYWTTANTLNPTQTNTNDGDAKFHTMNYFPAKDMMAIFPDMSNGGSISGSTRGWTWLENNFAGYLANQLAFNNAFSATATVANWEISTNNESSYSAASINTSPYSGYANKDSGWLLEGGVDGNVWYRHTFTLSSAPSRSPIILIAADDQWYTSEVYINGTAQSATYQNSNGWFAFSGMVTQPLNNLTSGSNTIRIRVTDTGSVGGLLVLKPTVPNRNYSLGMPLINLFGEVDTFFIKDAKTFNGWASGSFSSQGGYRWYGFNYIEDASFGNSRNVRWGFGWNNEGFYGSNDVFGGIGMAFNSYSAGDVITCCQDTTGINRSARVELYVR